MSPRPNELPDRELRGLELSGNPLSRPQLETSVRAPPKVGADPSDLHKVLDPDLHGVRDPELRAAH